jgi:hypothetical protein
MELISFLSLDVSDPENIPEIISFVYFELEKLKKSDFSTDNIHIFDGIVGKYLELAEYYECIGTDDLELKTKELISNILKNIEAGPTQREKANIELFENLSSLIMGVYNQIIRKHHDIGVLSEFNLLYNPNLSDKESVVQLIEEAIKYIKSDDQLSDRQKRQIIRLLTKALTNLKRSKTNWTSFFGDIHQTIIILGALGSLAGGIGCWVAISKANEKIIQATQLVERTSINQYYSHNIQLNYAENLYYVKGIEQLPSAIDLESNSLAIPEKTAENKESEE